MLASIDGEKQKLEAMKGVLGRFRNKEDRHKDKGNDLEQYRRVPLIPLDGANLCCDTAASSTKSCSCYSRYF